MFNPNSAIDRIKNSLSYKLGLAIIEHKKQYKEWGYIVLLYKLYKIKQQYKKEQKLYKQTIKIFPHLAYPKVEFCKDYNESIKYKYHLSYMLGETLICAHKTWYKGGYFKLPSLLKEKYKLYKNIQDIISILPQNLHYHFYNSTIKNHKINIQSLVYILKQHKDYNPILENIFHNFDFFIKHFDLINTWLLSNDFKEKYKQENHPYPSLLDPKKLNDDNEKINYKNIPAELAWEMNLPLPDRYDFIFISSHGTGEKAFQEMLARCDNLKILQKNKWYDNGRDRYKAFYSDLIVNDITKRCIPIIECNFPYYKRYLHMFNKKVSLVCLTRDPIKMVASTYNYKMIRDKNILHFSNINENNDIFNNFFYSTTNSQSIIDLTDLKKRIIHQRTITDNMRFTYIAKTHIKNLRNVERIYYIDSSEINPSKGYLKLKQLGENLGFEVPMNNALIDGVNFTHFLRFIFDIDKPIVYIHYLDHNSSLKIFIYHMYQVTQKKDITYLFNLQQYDKAMHSIFICSEAKDYDILIKNNEIQEEIYNKLSLFFNKINDYIDLLRKISINEDDILKVYSEDKQTYTAFRELIEYEFEDIFKKKIDILEKWKYYLRFMKLYSKGD
ncbi:DUF2972 domain-containing protein [Campylobacter jejuni]|nr:DUF2972 domain-containing protein [Campylobacter lari]EGK7506783.1 DUF2972 domain-containing protein [Campylobacter lari]